MAYFRLAAVLSVASIVGCIGDDPRVVVDPVPVPDVDGGEPAVDPGQNLTDAAAGADSNEPSADADAGWDGELQRGNKWVFLSNAPHPATEAKNADEICTSEIRRRKPSASAIGWIAIEGLSPTLRVGGYVGPRHLPRGTLVFRNLADLTLSGPQRPIIESVDRVVEGRGPVWTGLQTNGDPSGKDCDKWVTGTDTTGVATVGAIAALGPDWVNKPQESKCGGTAHLICIEQ